MKILHRGRTLKYLEPYLKDLNIDEELKQFEEDRQKYLSKYYELEEKRETIEPVIQEAKDKLEEAKTKAEVFEGDFIKEAKKQEKELDKIKKGYENLLRQISNSETNYKKAEKERHNLLKTKFKELYNSMTDHQDDYKKYKEYKSKADYYKGQYDYKLKNKDKLASGFKYFFNENIDR